MGFSRTDKLVACFLALLVASTAHAQAPPAEPPETLDCTECTVIVVDAVNGAPVPDVEFTDGTTVTVSLHGIVVHVQPGGTKR